MLVLQALLLLLLATARRCREGLLLLMTLVWLGRHRSDLVPSMAVVVRCWVNMRAACCICWVAAAADVLLLLMGACVCV
jgi:hypothetical protein